MEHARRSYTGIKYLPHVLLEKPLTVTRIMLWDIAHHDTSIVDVRMKIGRYAKKKSMFGVDSSQVDTLEPKSELTLDSEEISKLIDYLETHYEPFKRGVDKFIPLTGSIEEKNIEHLRELICNPDKTALTDFLLSNDIVPEELHKMFVHRKKLSAIQEFETMLGEDLTEPRWQKWFEENTWVLCTDFVRSLEERDIDTHNISDFLLQAYDGFLDLVEIKRPSGTLKFWADSKDHDNYVPHQDLVKAITQTSKYVFELEQEANSVKFLKRVGGVGVIKPRAILIFGRSCDWNDEQKNSFRILNASYHNLTIMTYDHILARAKKMVE